LQVVYDDHMKGKNHASKMRAAQLAASGELAGQLQCSVCNVYAATHDILQAHMEGKAHKKKVAAQGLKGEDLRCDLCDVTSTDKEGHMRHLGGKRHRENLEGPQEAKVPSDQAMGEERTKVIDYNTFDPASVPTKAEKVEEVKME
jgi:hypothetical protein